MPTITIDVTDDLQEQMSTVQANWSEICRRAIEAEIAHQKTQQQDQTIGAPPGKQWMEEPLDHYRSDKVIARYGNRGELKSADVWISELIKVVNNSQFHLGTSYSMSSLLGEGVPVQLLGPGKDWAAGNVRLNVQWILRYLIDQPDSESVEGSGS